MAENTVRVFLARSVGTRGGKLYGPGWANVPKALADAVGLAPELEQTDGAGRPLADSIAASVVGAGSTSGSEVTSHTGIPHPPRDDEGELTNPNVGVTARDVTAAAIADAAESGERTGGNLNAETGAHLDESRVLTSQPGNTTASAESTSETTKSTGERKPSTKTALREYGDAEKLRELAKDRGVKVKEDATKAEIVDKLYEAEVVL